MRIGRLLIPAAVAAAALLPTAARPAAGPGTLLGDHLLVTWYGNPHSSRMGVLGQASGAARAAALRRQAAAYAQFTAKTVLPAYHLVAVVAQPTAAGGNWRRRESAAVIEGLLQDARANGFHLVLDVQPGRARVADEVEWLRPYLSQPDVHLALDPEFAMLDGEVPGSRIGHLHAADINAALDVVESIVIGRDLPPKVVIVHQFTLAMLPDKAKIRVRPRIDLALDMDGFGSPSLKHASYRAVMRQHQLPFAGFKLFYRQDTNLLDPASVMRISPLPSVVIYQ
jgi:hypothetical protein